MENLDDLTLEEKTNILNSGLLCSVVCTKKINCNPRLPQYHNISFTNLRSNDAKIYDKDKTWRTVDKEDLFESVILRRIDDVNNAGINNINASKISIYPNPTNGDFTITGLELVGTVSSLSLTDMNGKVVKVLDTKATKFSMASIKPGVYFLNIRADNKQEVLKIVKE
jgi:hypothetical protein